MKIPIELVKELRAETGAGVLQCREALEMNDGDLEKATSYLREKGLGIVAKKADREASEGIVEAYGHPGGRVGVLGEVNCETDFVARTDNFKAFCRDIAMHVAASSPLCVTREELDQEVVAKEREIYKQQALNEGKPEKIIDKIVDGKIEKYFAEVVLSEQPYVKDNDLTVDEFVKNMIGSLGENIQIRRFARFRLGE